MAKTALICEQCGGPVVLDESKEYGICSFCRSKFLFQRDQLIYQVTQNITKHIYGHEGKDAEELISEGYRLLELGNRGAANSKFRKAIDVEPNSWGAWLGYASTGGDCGNVRSITTAYQSAYVAATTEDQMKDTFVDMVQYFPNKYLRASYIRSYLASPANNRTRIFQSVKNVLGCDESEMALLAYDLNPQDWNAVLAMAIFRKIRAKWCKREGLFSKHLPAPAAEVRDLYMNAYRFAMMESQDATDAVVSCINRLGEDPAYTGLLQDLREQMRKKY